jgi:Family of unknown function (DUF5701)
VCGVEPLFPFARIAVRKVCRVTVSTSTFHAQLDHLVELGYPALANLDEPGFRDRLAHLEELVPGGPEAADRVPFVIVVSRTLVDPYATVPLLRLVGGREPGVVDRNHAPGDLATYHPLPELRVPDVPAYLLVGVERGEEFCGVPPEQALPVITGRGRTPLTIDEGIAVVTQAPRLLEKNKCFMLSGSRRHDRRVPALWISERAPKLGWCWDGNPHSWLGVASAAGRVG